MLLTTIGFIIAGVVAGAAMVKFWDSIKNWLNTVAADAVERHLGYSARSRMQKAVAIIDRVMDKLKNRSIIYTKKSSNETYFDKTTITAEARVADIDQDILNEINKQDNHISQVFEYKM